MSLYDIRDMNPGDLPAPALTRTAAPVLTPQAVLGRLPTKRKDWAKRVRTSLSTGRILRELVKTAVVLALTTKTAPKTADDVAIIAEQIANEVGL